MFKSPLVPYNLRKILINFKVNIPIKYYEKNIKAIFKMPKYKLQSLNQMMRFKQVNSSFIQ